MITRRFLLASLAAVAGAVAIRELPAAGRALPPPAPALPPAAPVVTDREDLFLDAYRRAAKSLLEATETRDFSPWAREQPARYDLAYWMMRLTDLRNPSALEATLTKQMRDIWFRLTRPDWIMGDDDFPD